MTRAVRRGALVAADRYLDAVRHMRASQLLTRPRRLVPPRLLAAGRDAASPGWTAAAAGVGVDPAPQSGPQPAPEEARAFSAAGAARAFPAPAFWSDESDGLLFLFHLHGFSDLARYAAGVRTPPADAFWVEVLVSWLRDCGEPRLPAWHPFPASGRIVAWSAALSAGGWPAELAAAMQASLRRQLRLLRRSVEHDIGGNHVLRNAAALVIGGVCAHDTAAERRGLRLLRRQLAAQVLADGGHEERSPAYHRAVLADLDDVAAVLRAARGSAPGWLEATRDRMRAWLATLAGPDGALPLLNDAWEGPPAEVRSAAGAEREPAGEVVDLADTGYVVLRRGGDQAVLDVAPLAPAHLPPHAHADALSFVLWADGAPLAIDPGAFAYAGPDRLRFRGTAAHNTVEVDGRDQCDLWGPFRAAHMPAVRRGPIRRVQDAVVVEAEHDGYRRLADPVIHRRTFCWLPGDGLVVVDRLVAREEHAASTRIHLAPGVDTDGERAGPLVVRALGEGPPPVVETGAYAPFLGQEVPTDVIRRDLTCRPGALFGWALVRPAVEAELTAGRVVVRRPGREPLELSPA